MSTSFIAILPVPSAREKKKQLFECFQHLKRTVVSHFSSA